MFATGRTRLNSIMALAADVSLTVISDRVARGSLANARRALDERMEFDVGSQGILRGLENRALA